MKISFPIINHETMLLPFYVTGIGMKDNQNHILRKEGYPNYQIAICTKGEGRFLAKGKEFSIHKGMGFFFVPGIPHEYFSVVEPWKVKWVVFEGSQVQSVLKLLRIGEFEVFNINEFDKINALIENIDFIIESEEINKMLKCSSLLYSLIIEVGDCININKSQKNINSHDKLDLVIEYMDCNYSRDVSLKEMADLIKVSPYFLCRLFRQHYYTTPFKYLIRLRIQKAKQYFFNSPNLLVKDVAHTVGFNDISYFCSVFKEYEGVTPAEFRDMHGYLYSEGI